MDEYAAYHLKTWQNMYPESISLYSSFTYSNADEPSETLALQASCDKHVQPGKVAALILALRRYQGKQVRSDN